MKRCVRTLLLLAFVVLLAASGAVTIPARSSRSAPPTPVVKVEPRTIEGELRRGDDRCEHLCDKHRLAWAADGEVRLSLRGDGIGTEAVRLAVFGPDGREVPGGDMWPGAYVHSFAVRGGEEYEVRVVSLRKRFSGEYELLVTPPPATEVLAPERPIPPPPTIEEEEPDDLVAARIAKETEGWSVVGKPTRFDLAKKPRTIEVRAKAGRCYMVIVQLEAGARPADPDDGLEVELHTKDRYVSRMKREYYLSESRRIMYAGSRTYPCTASAGSIELKLGGPGTGHAVATLYEYRTDARALVEEAMEDEADWCTFCMRQRSECQQTGRSAEFSTCRAQWNSCVRGLKVRCTP